MRINDKDEIVNILFTVFLILLQQLSLLFIILNSIKNYMYLIFLFVDICLCLYIICSLYDNKNAGVKISNQWMIYMITLTMKMTSFCFFIKDKIDRNNKDSIFLIYFSNDILAYNLIYITPFIYLLFSLRSRNILENILNNKIIIENILSIDVNIINLFDLIDIIFMYSHLTSIYKILTDNDVYKLKKTFIMLIIVLVSLILFGFYFPIYTNIEKSYSYNERENLSIIQDDKVDKAYNKNKKNNNKDYNVYSSEDNNKSDDYNNIDYNNNNNNNNNNNELNDDVNQYMKENMVIPKNKMSIQLKGKNTNNKKHFSLSNNNIFENNKKQYNYYHNDNLDNNRNSIRKSNVSSITSLNSKESTYVSSYKSKQLLKKNYSSSISSSFHSTSSNEASSSTYLPSLSSINSRTKKNKSNKLYQSRYKDVYTDVYITAKFHFIVGFFLIDTPFLIYRLLFCIRYKVMLTLIVKNILFLLFRSYKLNEYRLIEKEKHKKKKSKFDFHFYNIFKYDSETNAYGNDRNLEIDREASANILQRVDHNNNALEHNSLYEEKKKKKEKKRRNKLYNERSISRLNKKYLNGYSKSRNSLEFNLKKSKERNNNILKKMKKKKKKKKKNQVLEIFKEEFKKNSLKEFYEKITKQMKNNKSARSDDYNVDKIKCDSNNDDNKNNKLVERYINDNNNNDDDDANPNEEHDDIEIMNVHPMDTKKDKHLIIDNNINENNVTHNNDHKENHINKKSEKNCCKGNNIKNKIKSETTKSIVRSKEKLKPSWKDKFRMRRKRRNFLRLIYKLKYKRDIPIYHFQLRDHLLALYSFLFKGWNTVNFVYFDDKLIFSYIKNFRFMLVILLDYMIKIGITFLFIFILLRSHMFIKNKDVIYIHDIPIKKNLVENNLRFPQSFNLYKYSNIPLPNNSIDIKYINRHVEDHNDNNTYIYSSNNKLKGYINMDISHNMFNSKWNEIFLIDKIYLYISIIYFFIYFLLFIQTSTFLDILFVAIFNTIAHLSFYFSLKQFILFFYTFNGNIYNRDYIYYRLNIRKLNYHFEYFFLLFFNIHYFISFIKHFPLFMRIIFNIKHIYYYRNSHASSGDKELKYSVSVYILFLLCKYCYAPINLNMLLFGQNILNNIILIDNINSYTWLNIFLLILFKTIQILMTQTNYFIIGLFIIHILLYIIYAIHAQILRYIILRKIEILYVFKNILISMYNEIPLVPDNNSPYTTCTDILKYYSEEGFFSSESNMIPNFI
ncbi:conserved Plasmodium membrane protein, unknown function [Plasmodium gaboni]|uniref:Uncharacterized protein n=1 Tax=Plasmodium gaboni TaxID=647221 RepID=A0ABY1UMH0_9APIC|nr:conserved Plasmodium membrane protein, unknown function [Plasmodium gaboni]